MIGNDTYLVDFLKYILIRDPIHRPSIDNVIKRFEHIHAIILSNQQGKREATIQTIQEIMVENSLEDDVNFYIAHVFKDGFEIEGKGMVVKKVSFLGCCFDDFRESVFSKS